MKHNEQARNDERVRQAADTFDPVLSIHAGFCETPDSPGCTGAASYADMHSVEKGSPYEIAQVLASVIAMAQSVAADIELRTGEPVQRYLSDALKGHLEDGAWASAGGDYGDFPTPPFYGG